MVQSPAAGAAGKGSLVRGTGKMPIGRLEERNGIWTLKGEGRERTFKSLSGISPGTEVLCWAEEMEVEFRSDFKTLLAPNNATITR